MSLLTTLRIAFIVKKYWKELLIGILAILFLPIVMISYMFSLKVKPMTNSDINKIYIDAANSASMEGVTVDWHNLVAIDAVRFKQDFRKAKPSEAFKLAKMFIGVRQVEKIEYYEVAVPNPSDPLITLTETRKRIVKVTEYYLIPFEEVLDKLRFNEHQKKAATIYATLGFNSGSSGGSGSGIGNSANADEFINLVKDGAITTYNTYKVLPSITIAQAILESGYGGSRLAREANNLFGIKADSGWSGEKKLFPTTEYNGQRINAFFRVYNSWEHSLNDHGYFLVANPRYREHGFFNSLRYQDQAMALQNAGYATVQDDSGNYIYAKLLITIITQYNLDRYDQLVLAQN